jgi:hypothetical protein
MIFQVGATAMAANLLAYGSKLHACDALIRYDAIQRCFFGQVSGILISGRYLQGLTRL